MKRSAPSIELPARELLSPKGNRRDLAARSVIERVGIEEILSRIRAGESQREIALSLKVDVATLNRFLRSHADETRAAMMESAEAWLDRGLRELELAKGKDNAEVTRAKAVAQECARRAAIRNPRYSDKQSVELSGPDGGPVAQAPSIVVYLPENNRDRPCDR